VGTDQLTGNPAASLSTDQEADQIEWFLRYGEGELPELAAFLGYGKGNEEMPIELDLTDKAQMEAQLKLMTNGELKEAIDLLGEELGRRTAKDQWVRVTQTFSAYNERRYSRPWICRITGWKIGDRPEVEWGRYLGTARGGEVEITARPGDIIRTGQKDGRGNHGSADWYFVGTDGLLYSLTEAEARSRFQGK
jgi:hypothetical protein